MSFNQIIGVLNMRVPIPAFLEKPISMPLPSTGSIRKSLSQWARKMGLANAKRPAPNRRAQLFSAVGRLAIRSEAWCAIDDILFQVSDETMIIGELKAGAEARARGILLADGRRVATCLTVH